MQKHIEIYVALLSFFVIVIVFSISIDTGSWWSDCI